MEATNASVAHQMRFERSRVDVILAILFTCSLGLSLKSQESHNVRGCQGLLRSLQITPESVS
jgi:hypothetical protein